MNLIVLYGIGRNNIIAQEYFKSIISEYKSIKADYKLIYFYNKIGRIENFRSNEFKTLNSSNENSFDSDLFFCYEKVHLKISSILNECKKFPDLYEDNYKSYSNLLSQLWLLKQVGSSIRFEDYSSVLFLRDDILLSGEIGLKNLLLLKDQFSFLSSWSWHNGYNDRFFFTNSYGAYVFSKRLDRVLDFVHNFKFLQGEQLLKYTLKSSGINCLPISIRTMRIRSNNNIIKDNSIFWNFFLTRNITELLYLIIKFKIIKFGKSFIYNMGKGSK